MVFKRIEEIEQDYMLAEEAADFLRAPINTVYFYVQRRMLPVYRPGKRLLFKKADLQRFVEKSREE